MYWEAEQDIATAKSVEKVLDTGPLEATVDGLTPGKVYKLRVMAWSLGGAGKMSSPEWEFQMGKSKNTKINQYCIFCKFLKNTGNFCSSIQFIL